MRLIRRVHMWAGTIASLFILVIAATGIVLDHRDELAVKMKILASNGLKIDSGGVFDKLRIRPPEAVEIALKQFGPGASLHKIELKAIKGGLVYKIESDRREAIHIDPANGTIYRLDAGQFDMVRWAKAIHTGEGLVDNPWHYDALAAVLMFLGLSGVWTFWKRGWRS
jgi:hypothetical protein